MLQKYDSTIEGKTNHSNEKANDRGAKMDNIDRTILSMLQENGKLSYGEIGAHVKLSVSGVKERLRKLQEKGVIRKFVAVLEPKNLGLGVCSFVLVEVDKYENEENFKNRVLEMPEVQECHHITGMYGYLLKVRLADTGHLEKFVGEKLRSMTGVLRTNTLMALSPIKETTSLLIN